MTTAKKSLQDVIDATTTDDVQYLEGKSKGKKKEGAMLKEAFLKGFASKLKRMADDVHRLAKGVEKGKIDVNVGASQEVKDFVSKELGKFKREVGQKLDKTIKPKHIIGAAATGGASLGLAKSLTDKALGGKNDGDTRRPPAGSQYGQPRGLAKYRYNKEY